MNEKIVEENQTLYYPWYVTDKGKVGVRSVDYLNLLNYLNIKVAKISNTKEFVLLENNILRPIEVSDIVQIALKRLLENVELATDFVSIDEVKEAWINKSRILLDMKTLYYTEEVEFKQKFDSKDESHFYFLNTVVRVDKDWKIRSN